MRRNHGRTSCLDTEINGKLGINTDECLGAALLKFSVIFRDLSVLTKGLVQSSQNSLVFPLDNLLKVGRIARLYLASIAVFYCADGRETV